MDDKTKELVEQIKILLDNAEIALPGGSTKWTLAERVQIACMAATDQSDRLRAETAEARLAALKCCHVCKKPTDMACSDCRINLATTVYVCADLVCRSAHERVCSHNLQQRLAALTSAEGCDVEGARKAFREKEGLDAMPAALAAGCAPLRARYEALVQAGNDLCRNIRHHGSHDNWKMLANALSALDGSGA